MAGQIFVGDIGTEIRVQVLDENGAVVDVSGAAVRQLKMLKPGAIAVTVKAATDGSIQEPAKTGALGWMHYTTVLNDLDTAGEWKVQGYVEVGAWKGHTVETRFTVFKVIGP